MASAEKKKNATYAPQKTESKGRPSDCVLSYCQIPPPPSPVYNKFNVESLDVKVPFLEISDCIGIGGGESSSSLGRISGEEKQREFPTRKGT